MSWTANSCVITLAILFLWRVEEIAEACSCSPAHPQQAFCSSDVGKLTHWVKWMSGKLFFNSLFVLLSRIWKCNCWEGGGQSPTLCVYNYRGWNFLSLNLSFHFPPLFSVFLSKHLLLFLMVLFLWSHLATTPYFLICSIIIYLNRFYKIFATCVIDKTKRLIGVFFSFKCTLCTSWLFFFFFGKISFYELQPSFWAAS